MCVYHYLSIWKVWKWTLFMHKCVRPQGFCFLLSSKSEGAHELNVNIINNGYTLYIQHHTHL